MANRLVVVLYELLTMFLICTIANSLHQYEAMKASFAAAGFDEDRCSFTLFDNSKANIHDPYKAINSVIAETNEPYVIFCHQDVLLNKGDGMSSIMRVIENLNVLDPKWAVFGNAGGAETFDLAIRITDPHGADVSQGKLPQRVQTLDEDFLVIRSSCHLHCSAKLGGFHLYATDLCLNAMTRGYSCYVVDFHLTHLSPGNVGEGFYKSLKLLQREHDDKFIFCYVRTTCVLFFLSRFQLLRWCFGNPRVIEWVRFHPKPYLFLLRVSKKLKRWAKTFSNRKTTKVITNA